MPAKRKASRRAGNLGATLLVEQRSGGRFELSIARKNIDIVVELGKSRISIQAPGIHRFNINGKSFDNGSGVKPGHG
jgi:hypothetical protein